MLMRTSELAASTNNEIYYKLDAENRKEAIKEVMTGRVFDMDDIVGEDGHVRFWIGDVYEFVPVVDVDRVIENMQYDCDDDMGDFAEGYLCDANREQIEDLEARLSKSFREWEDDYRLAHTNFTVQDVEHIII